MGAEGPAPWLDGPVSFRDFMQYCLYDPQRGYYRGRRDRIFGKAGDFFTSPLTHPVFAECLGDAITAAFDQLSLSPPHQLLELGSGSGDLSRCLRDFWRSSRPSLLRELDYIEVDLDSKLPESLSGVVLANEFFDAFPVHRVVRTGEDLSELYVELGDDGLQEVLRPLSDNRLSTRFARAFPESREGWVYEISLAAFDYLEDLAERLDDAVVIILDYGYLREEYHRVERPLGTILGYKQHEVIEDPLANPQEQDLTAHLHFDLFIEFAAARGWSSHFYDTQREFLNRWGLVRRLQSEEAEGLFNPERLRDRLALKLLLEPGGISDHLRVLEIGIGKGAVPIGGQQ